MQVDPIEVAVAAVAIVILVLLCLGLLKRRREMHAVKKGVDVANPSPQAQKPTQNEALYKAVLGTMPFGVVITDDGGNVRYFNPYAEVLTLFREHAIKGANLGHIFPSVATELNRGVRERKGFVNELAFVDAQGRHRQLRLTLIPPDKVSIQPIVFVLLLEEIGRKEEREAIGELERQRTAAKEYAAAEEVRAMLGKTFQFGGAIGPCEEMQRIYRLIQKAAGTTSNVLITGEAGTGKEMVARAIHVNGPRQNKPFISVNCGEISASLIEDDLFGHVRGAFTGAVADHPGRLRLADGGSVFIREVEKLPHHLQAKVLKVLQEKSITPVGGTKPIPLDLRVISASSKDLKRAIDEGTLRKDFFYRLSVIQVDLPPLRNRKEDIPFLIQHFIKKFAAASGKRVYAISPDALRYLMHYDYPGNVRELENIIEHAVAVTDRDVLTERDLPLRPRENLSSHFKPILSPEDVKLLELTSPPAGAPFFDQGLSLDDALMSYEKTMLLAALKKADGVQKKAAELLGINYRSFRHRLEKYGML